MKRRRKPFLVGFDTEDDSRGGPFLWAFVHRSGQTFTRTQGDALQTLANMVAEHPRERVVAWATNLEYDLCNLFPPDRVAELSLKFGRSVLCGASWRGLDFRDTMRHVPVSVAEWGELVGLKKRERDLFAKRPKRGTWKFQRYVNRCVRDAAITHRAAATLADGYKRFGQHSRMTLASTALAIWRERYWKRPVERVDGRTWKWALEAYHGGRTEAFALGTFADVRAIDVASMFPWAMLGRFPVPWGLKRIVGAVGELQPSGIYEADIVSALDLPRLPVRTPTGTLYPNGRWRGWYVGEELLAFRRAGGRARVLRGVEFLEHTAPFVGYVRAMFRRKQRARGALRLLYKLLLNSLYGKFGQQGRVVRAMPLHRFEKLRAAPLTWREWHGLAIFAVDGAPPPWGNNVWPAIVTARARVRLADEMAGIRAAGGRVLYCDTDSVMYMGPGARRYGTKAARPGEFELRGQYRRALLVGKKEYGLDLGRGRWEFHAKGVPFAERRRYLETGEAEFERPVRLREAAHTGEKANVWKRVRKVRRVRVEPGRLAADGSLRTPKISALDVFR